MAKKKTIEKKTLSDEDYWKQYSPEIDETYDGESAGEVYTGMQYNDISIDVSIKFKDMDREIFETKEKDINCNLPELNKFFNKMKKTIRMLDETKKNHFEEEGL